MTWVGARRARWRLRARRRGRLSVDGGHWDCGVAVCVIVARDFVYAAGVDRAAGLVFVDVCTVVEDDV
jgi:hypothetical protein